MGKLGGENEALKLFCPYCTHEITPDTTQCPQCGYAYGPDTLNVLTSRGSKTPQNNPAELPKPVQANKKFKIVYPTPKAFVNNYLPDVGTGGLFVKTREPLDPGEKFSLRISFPFLKEECEVLCEVAWVRKEERITPKPKHPPGMGLKFVNPTKELAEKFLSILRQPLLQNRSAL